MAGIFGWDFWAPDEPTMDPLELLEQLAQLVAEPGFVKKRRAFHDKRRQMLEDGVCDQTAVVEMNQLAAEYATAARGTRRAPRSATPAADPRHQAGGRAGRLRLAGNDDQRVRHPPSAG